MKTIQTKYLPATDRKPSRIKAWSVNVSIIVNDDLELEGGQAFWPAANKLALKMGWHGDMICGSTDSGYVFVFANDERFTIGG